MIAIARELYVEALAICEEEVHRNPDRMGDLIRLQWRMCLCLSKIPGAEGEMKHFARLTVESFDTFLKANPDGAAAYAEFGKEASRVSGGG